MFTVIEMFEPQVLFSNGSVQYAVYLKWIKMSYCSRIDSANNLVNTATDPPILSCL